MVAYKKIYMDHFGYGIQDFIPCEACGKPAVEIHHINGRGKGKDVIGNLIALCRKCHSRAHGTLNPVSKSEFQYIHNSFMSGNHKQYLK